MREDVEHDMYAPTTQLLPSSIEDLTMFKHLAKVPSVS